MSITISEAIKADRGRVVEEVQRSIQYWGFYSGETEVDGEKVEYRRDQGEEDRVVIVVEEYVGW